VSLGVRGSDPELRVSYMKHRTKLQPDNSTQEEDLEITKEESREIRRRVKDHEDPVRYMVVSRLLPRWKLWFDVSSETYCDKIEAGTLFKRRKYADAILEQLCQDNRDRDIVVAKVTTKGTRIKVLKYYA